MRVDRRERRLNLVIAAVALALVPLGVLFASAVWGGIGDRDLPDCEDWSFDQSAWDEDVATRDDQALALVRCDSLIGMDRTEVIDLLGKRRRENAPRWEYPAGAVRDYLGPGDGQALYVHFDERDRVRRASLAYGGRRGLTPEGRGRRNRG